MSNTYTWVIESLDCIPSIDGQTNVVCNVHWRVKATDGTFNTVIYGTQGLTYTAGNPFISYEGLTKETVIQWVQEAMGIDQVMNIQLALDKQLDSLANPPIISPALPWDMK